MPVSVLSGVIAAVATPVEPNGEPDCTRATKRVPYSANSKYNEPSCRLN